ncbi:hypothetical protein SeLEV6574_g04204 [Synchytrium endobioticum]|uniref:Uncharacterized protein n=1 Tax=Synchytrium endobioticum TaxID=286115 RepID=A0A507D0I4_9FUNG|nr:hypothetical protein SeLEV6574_g04204 [Synchytrium endobioticum]
MPSKVGPLPLVAKTKSELNHAPVELEPALVVAPLTKRPGQRCTRTCLVACIAVAVATSLLILAAFYLLYPPLAEHAIDTYPLAALVGMIEAISITNATAGTLIVRVSTTVPSPGLLRLLDARVAIDPINVSTPSTTLLALPPIGPLSLTSPLTFETDVSVPDPVAMLTFGRSLVASLNNTGQTPDVRVRVHTRARVWLLGIPLLPVRVHRLIALSSAPAVLAHMAFANGTFTARLPLALTTDVVSAATLDVARDPAFPFATVRVSDVVVERGVVSAALAGSLALANGALATAPLAPTVVLRDLTTSAPWLRDMLVGCAVTVPLGDLVSWLLPANATASVVAAVDAVENAVENAVGESRDSIGGLETRDKLPEFLWWTQRNCAQSWGPAPYLQYVAGCKGFFFQVRLSSYLQAEELCAVCVPHIQVSSND